MGSHGILYQIRQCHPPRQSTVSCSVFFAFVPSNCNFDHNPMIPCDAKFGDNTDTPNCFIYFVLCYCLTSLPFRPQLHNTLVKAFFLLQIALRQQIYTSRPGSFPSLHNVMFFLINIINFKCGLKAPEKLANVSSFDLVIM